MATASKAKKATKKGGRTTAKKEEKKVIDGAGIPDQTQAPTAIGAWKKVDETRAVAEDGFIAELPSGNVIRMYRTLDMPILLKTGQIPNPLASIVQRMIDTRSNTIPLDQTDTVAMLQLLDMLNETAVRCIISPPFDMPEKRKKGEDADAYQDRLSEWQPDFTDAGRKQHQAHGDDDPCTCERKISAWDLTMEDRMFIFAVAQGAAADLASFRQEQTRTLADLQAGD